MLGAIAGDMIGAPFEGRHTPKQGFPLFSKASAFTDDSVCTLAVAEALTTDGNFAKHLRYWVRRYPDAGYGSRFKTWAFDDNAPAYGSFGNGAAMRVCPVGIAAKTLDEARALARISARISHDHPAAEAAAEAVATCVFLARCGQSARDVRATLEKTLHYALPDTLPQPFVGMDITAAGTVPVALYCALNATSFETAVRTAISLGGDTDTLACIAGGVAEALFGLPPEIKEKTLIRLPTDLCAIATAFAKHFPHRGTGHE